MKFQIMGGIHIHIDTQNIILTFFSQPSHISLKTSNIEHKIWQKYKPSRKLEHLEIVLLLDFKRNHRFLKHLTSCLPNSAWGRSGDFGNVVVIANNLLFSDDKKIDVVSRFLKKKFIKNVAILPLDF